MHTNNVYKEGELERLSTCKDFLHVRQEGSRIVSSSRSWTPYPICGG